MSALVLRASPVHRHACRLTRDGAGQALPVKPIENTINIPNVCSVTPPCFPCVTGVAWRSRVIPDTDVRLRHEDELACGAAAGQVLVCAGGFGQGIFRADADVQLALGDPPEEVA